MFHVNDAPMEPVVRFAFTLPAPLLLGAQPGRWHPCLHGVRVDVAPDGHVIIGCYDRSITYGQRQVIDQAARFLDVVGRTNKAIEPIPIVAQLSFDTDTRMHPQRWTIIFAARIAIMRAPIDRSAPVLVA